MFCQKCGNPSETPICPACAAAEAPVETPVQEVAPAVEAPVVESPAVEAPVAEDPAIQLGAPVEPPVKKSKKGLWISLVAVVAAAAVAAVAFWPALSRMFTSPEDYLQEVTKDSLSSFTDGLANLYGAYLKGEVPESDYNHVDTKFSIKLNDGLAGMLATTLQSQGINLTADALKSIDLTINGTIDGDATQPNLLQYDLGVGLGGKELLGIKVTLDYKNSVVYLAVPRLSEKSIKVNLKQFGIDLSSMSLMDLFAFDPSAMLVEDEDYFVDDYEDYYDDYEDYDDDYLSFPDEDYGLMPPTAGNSVLGNLLGLLEGEQFASLQANLPDADEFQAMLDRFIEAALNEITQVEKTSQDVTVNGHTQNQTALVATIDATTVGNMAKAVLNQAQNDPTLKEMLDAVDAFAAASAGQSLGLHGQMVAAIPELIAELDSFIAENATAESLTLTVYVDGDELMGLTMGVQGLDALSYTTVKEGDTYYFQISSPLMAMVSLSGSYTEQGDVTKGDLTLATQGVNYTLDYEYSDTSLILGFALPAELLSEIGVPAGIVTDNVRLELGAWASNATVTLPENAIDVNDQAQLMAWATEAVGKLPDLLKDLGVPESVISQLLAEAMGSLI